jgi:ABC-type Fe3+-hydroxamate transport system substrate-binding protein
VLAKPKVAGFSDVSMEALIRQRPDLVVLPVDKAGTMAELERLGITVMPLDTRSLSGLLSAVEELGQATGHQKEAAQVLSRLRASIGRAQARAAGRRKPGVLFSVMHSYNGLGYISEISAVGRDGFFSQLLEIAGGRNVYQGSLSFPRLSREAIFYLKPEIIVDLVRDRAEAEEIRPAWQSLSSLPAIRDGRLYLFSEESDTVPGPRIWSTIDKLSEAIHPSGPGARES